jgi:hypothetical protein
MIIDINMHHLPKDLFHNDKILQGFLGSVPRQWGEIAYVSTLESGKQQLVLEKPRDIRTSTTSMATTPWKPSCSHDEAGVDIALLRVPVWQEWLHLDTCKLVNDEAADMCRRSNGRLFANAVLPPWAARRTSTNSSAALRSWDGRRAACLPLRPALSGRRGFQAYLKVLNDMNIPVVVHHTPLPVYWQASSIGPTYAENSAHHGPATAVGRELFSGMFEEFPNLKFIHTMMGGNWFAQQKLLTPKLGAKKEAMHRLDMSQGERITHVS